ASHPLPEVGGVLGRAERVAQPLERRHRRVDLEHARRHGLRRARAGRPRPRTAAPPRQPAGVPRLQVLEAHPSPPPPPPPIGAPQNPSAG
uniref:Uncharacterized protein n=1 Tax=Oryza brachyantha TaxID=4533 RepID=J3KYE1_ORYBR